jgi:hypothetical protein
VDEIPITLAADWQLPLAYDVLSSVDYICLDVYYIVAEYESEISVQSLVEHHPDETDGSE